jgi:hypothetical protein
MGFIDRVDHDGKRMYATAKGPITAADIRTHLHVERREGGLGYAELIDAREASPAFCAEDVRGVVAWLREFARLHALGPTAVVVSTPVAYGMMRMIDLLTEDFCVIRPFLDMDAAEAWLRNAKGERATPGDAA